MPDERPDRNDTERNTDEERPDERYDSGQPGGGAGRRDEVGGSGVYPASAGNAPRDAEIRAPASWGQGERGAAGYEDAGTSEINPTLGRHDAAAEERRKEQRPFASERRKQQGSFGPGAGGERMSGRGGHEHPNEQR
jgi:hypothetical protein